MRLGAWTLLGTGLVLLARDLRLVERFVVRPSLDRTWTGNLPFRSDAFRALEHLVETHRADDRLRALLGSALGSGFDADGVQEYEAIPLAAFLEATGQTADRGPYLTITNVMGQRTYLTDEDIAREQPVVVVGLDDETELFNLTFHYRTLRDASWEEPEQPRPWLARPLGPFLFYPREPAAHLVPINFTHVGLEFSSFSRSNDDPLSGVRDLEAGVGHALYGSTEGCLTCHAFREIGTTSHHLDARTGAPAGGYGLPLEDYSIEVMAQFLFDQPRAAAAIGVSALPLDSSVARGLWDLLHPNIEPALTTR